MSGISRAANQTTKTNFNMVKYLNILMLIVFVVGATVDIAVLDPAEFKSEWKVDSPQKLSMQFDNVTDVDNDQHCADHCLHHLATFAILDLAGTSNMTNRDIPFGIQTLVSQFLKPSTPPPLFQLS